MNYFAIGQRIRKIRKAHQLSQEQLAEKVGISITHMSHIETGNTKLSLHVLVNLACALEVRTDELLFDMPPVERSAAVDSIVGMLDGCSTQQIKIIEDVVRAMQISLKKHL